MRVWLAIGCLLSACAWRGAQSAPTLTLRVPGETRQMQMAADGAVSGESFQLRPTGGGYRGTARAEVVDLSSDGQKIIGVIGDRIVELRLRVAGDVVEANGLFAGRLGRLETGPHAIFGYVGRCRYDLQEAGARFAGTRNCNGVDPASVELPPEFSALSADRRAMLLALLLSDSR